MTDRPAGPRRSLARLLPIAILAAGLAAFVAFGGTRWLSFEHLQAHHELIAAWVEAHGALGTIAYVAFYALVVAFSLPGAFVMTLLGGFLFGTWFGALLTVLGATVGATAVFLAARTAFGDVLRARAGPALRKMEAGFRENALCYLLVLRLVPLFPFFLVNLAAAFLGVRLATYVAATFVGIVPGTVVYSSVGAGLGAILQRGEAPDLGIVWKPEILGPLLGLAALALLPAIYKRMKAKRHG
jgi:uncharacterized membrane protein YdjX (TVP38/TMEM64 family)